MYRFARPAALALAATFSIHAAGCEATSASRLSASAVNPMPPVSQQLIVKFKPQTVACTAKAISGFSKTVDVRLTWLRPMSGNACVLIQESGNSDELAKARERLKKHPHIEWVEIDAPMRHH